MSTKLKSIAQVAHYWANQVQEAGESSNLRFDGPRLFSYRTVIGHIVKDQSGADVYITSRSTYSRSTGKQCSLMRAAIPKGARRLSMPWYTARGCDSLHFSAQGFASAAIGVIEEAADLIAKAERCRTDYTRGARLSEAQNLIDGLADYADVFGYPFTRPDSLTLENVAAEVEAARKAAALAVKQAEEARALKQAEELAQWVAGAAIYRHFEKTALRINGDDIETSRGASVPVAHAVQLWPTLKRWHDDGKTYTAGAHSIHLGHYTVKSFNADGLTVGCHVLPWSELVRIAGLLGLETAAEAIAA